MIVRQFISWVRSAPAGERAEATRALAQSWLVSDLSEDDRAAAEGALLMLLDDPSPLVRQAMAEVFAWSEDAPAAIVRALSCDQPSVALPILEFSPLLVDADLVDIAATGSNDIQCAIARRMHLPIAVCAALAEVGSASAILELIENPYAEIAQLSLDRIVERFGHLAAIREMLLSLDDLPSSTRMILVAKLSETLAQFVTAKSWLSADRAERVASEACERSTVNIAAQAYGDDMHRLLQHLRATGQLTAGLILRALLSGNVELFTAALIELSGLPSARVHALVDARSGHGVTALLQRAGLPASTFAAFRAALDARDEIGYVGTVGGMARLRRRMVERVLTSCEMDERASEPLLILLRRFATESAREEARLFCDELVADDEAYETEAYEAEAYETYDAEVYEADDAYGFDGDIIDDAEQVAA